MADQFTCERCGETFIKGYTDEEASAESKQLWGDLAPDDKAVICDNCFEVFIAWAKDRGYV